jgi:replication factor A2
MWNDSEFNSTFSSPGGNAGKEIKKNLIKHIVPVTGHTINECVQAEGETSVFEYNHIRFHQVCFMGIIRSVLKRANDTTYIIDDMTSTDINVKLQADETDDMESEEAKPNQMQFIENQYVKVYGIIKSLQGQKNLQAFRILPVKELNEITHHMLECMNASIYYFSKPSGECVMDMAGNGNYNAGVNQSSNAGNAGLSSLQNQVSNMIKQSKDSEGVNVSNIYATFSNVSKSDIKSALEFLSNEGHIYTTIDDEHFKTTDAS